MRDVVVSLVIFSLIPFAFFRPFWGLMLFTWLAYMRAPDLTWGFARSFRFSFMVAIIMFVSWFLFDKRPFMRRDRRSNLMIGLAIAVTISWLLVPQIAAWATSKYIEFLKVIAIALFTTAQIDSKKRVQAIVWLMTLSLAFYGVKGGLFGILVPGAEILQGPGGLLADNNDFSLAMTMNIPFLFYLAECERNPHAKRFLQVAAFLTVITVVLTGSRGGFLAMATVFGAIVLKSRYKTLGIAAGFLGVVIFIVSIPQEYRSRLLTLTTAVHKDKSAQGRLRAWAVAIRMIKDKPFFGIGFQNFVWAYPYYAPDKVKEQGGYALVAHNSYFQIWAESGTFAFSFFVGLIISTILLMRRLQRINRVRDGPQWIGSYAKAIEVTLYGFLMGAMFLNRAHFDFLYQSCAVGIALYPIAISEIDKHNRPRGRRGAAQMQIHRKDPYLAGNSIS